MTLIGTEHSDRRFRLAAGSGLGRRRVFSVPASSPLCWLVLAARRCGLLLPVATGRLGACPAVVGRLLAAGVLLSSCLVVGGFGVHALFSLAGRAEPAAGAWATSCELTAVDLAGTAYGATHGDSGGPVLYQRLVFIFWRRGRLWRSSMVVGRWAPSVRPRVAAVSWPAPWRICGWTWRMSPRRVGWRSVVWPSRKRSAAAW